jgi:hypothetical protein
MSTPGPTSGAHLATTNNAPVPLYMPPVWLHRMVIGVPLVQALVQPAAGYNIA